jgi:signal peptidase II
VSVDRRRSQLSASGRWIGGRISSGVKMIARNSVRLALLVAVVATIGCDRVSKHIATATLAGEPGRSYLADTIRLEYVENTGGFLSLGATLPPVARTAVFTIGTALALMMLVGAAVRFRWQGWSLIGTALVLAGGASNWIDRLVQGSVVDFMNIGVGPVRTGIFNVADMAIMVGGAFLLVNPRVPEVWNGLSQRKGRSG